jgi:lactoylglutathione lyase
MTNGGERIEILAVDHIGIRVTDVPRATAFYRLLGFEKVFENDAAKVVILRNRAGVEINFITNGSPGFDGRNVLMDVDVKHPGYTHVALAVASAAAAVEKLTALGIRISEGPVRLGDRFSLFVRDPDANVIELREAEAHGSPVGPRD